MPRVGERSDGEALAVSARCVLGIEEELEGRGALIVASDMILVAAAAVEKRRALVGA